MQVTQGRRNSGFQTHSHLSTDSGAEISPPAPQTFPPLPTATPQRSGWKRRLRSLSNVLRSSAPPQPNYKNQRRLFYRRIILFCPRFVSKHPDAAYTLGTGVLLCQGWDVYCVPHLHMLHQTLVFTRALSDLEEPHEAHRWGCPFPASKW